jgi:sugar phosphate isomerase/epimerase
MTTPDDSAAAMEATQGVSVSVVLISFGGTTVENVAAAHDLDFRWVQLRNVGTDLTVDHLTPPRREQLLRLLGEKDLAISSLSGGYGRLLDPGESAVRVAEARRLTRLARDLHCPCVTGHIGTLQGADWRRDREFLGSIGAWIDELERDGTVFAVESGSEHGEILRELIDHFDSACFRVNLDPANFLFYGLDPLSSCEALYDVSVHFHCKDAVRRPRAGAKAESSVAGHPSAVFADEVTAGCGEVPLARILAQVARRGVVRVAAVECESGDDRRARVRAAKDLVDHFFEEGSPGAREPRSRGSILQSGGPA